MKKQIGMVLFLVVCMLTGLVACTKQETPMEQCKETIKIVYPLSRGMGDKDISMLETWFKEKYPNAELEMISSNVTTVSDTVRSDLKNQSGADIFVTTEYDSFLADHLLEDITDMEAATKFRKSSMRELERDGKIYALPIGGGTLIGLHYNQTLFDQYGIEPPKTTEDFSELVNRIQGAIEQQNINKKVLCASMLYPSQVTVIYNSILAKYTQKSDYLKWIADYNESDHAFTDDIFQEYLQQIDITMQKDKQWFTSDDLVSSQSSAIESFLKGNAFLYVGDVKRCYDTMKNNADYQKDDIKVTGISVGMDGISYISYMDDLYIGVNQKYNNYSKTKQQMIEEILNYIVSGDSNIRNIFTFTGAYSSVYLEGQSVETIDDPYFEQINKCLENNYVAQEVSNTPFSYIFGRALITWRTGKLEKFMEEGESNIEKVTRILDEYQKNGNNVFQKSEEPIGTSNAYMEYQSNIVRSQETAIGNQVADMAKSYMNTDFALLNAGGIRASIPEGNVSQQTFNSVLPYNNYLVKIKVSGATLKQAIANAYNVGPTFKSGQFGEISGLRVELCTKKNGYEQYKQQMDVWDKENVEAGNLERNEASKKIVESLCEQDPNILNLEVVSVKDDDGNDIEDDKIYTVATIDYLLKDQDGYSMLAVLSENPAADGQIEIYTADDRQLTGSTKDVENEITSKCKTVADAFIDWVEQGNVLDGKIDGRINISDFIFVE